LNAIAAQLELLRLLNIRLMVRAALLRIALDPRWRA